MRSRGRSPKSRRGVKKQSVNNKLVQMKTPSRKSWNFYLVLGKSRDGRYVARAAKRGVKVKDLSKKRSSDFGPIKTLPKGSKIVSRGYKSRRAKKRS